MSAREQLSGFLKNEVVDLFCRTEIGSGVARTVYESPLLPGIVIKCELPAQSFQNITEWETWQEVKHTKWAKWFAPCIEISACGSVLLMKKTEKPSKYPDRMPVFMTDLKRANYGLIGRQIVAHDYGKNLLMQTGFTDRMRKADWWD